MGADDEDPVNRAAAERRERLRLLRAAKDLLDTPDDGGAPPVAPLPTEEEGVAATPAEPYAPALPREIATEESSVDRNAAARHERLKALREAKRLLETPDEDTARDEHTAEGPVDTDEEQKLNLKFRNYVPNDKQLQEHKLAPPVLPKFEDPVAINTAPHTIEDPFLNIAPKKPNWDLRRDIQKRLDKLERRTQKAIYQIYLKQQEEKQALEGNVDAIED